MYYFYNYRKNEVRYYLDLVDTLHGEPKDIEHFNKLATEEEKIIYCEDVNIKCWGIYCYISKDKKDLLEIKKTYLLLCKIWQSIIFKARAVKFQ